MARGGKREGAGRKDGSLGKITVELKATITETCKAYTVQAVQTWYDIMTNPSAPPAARAACANSIVDRGWGKVPQTLIGDEANPIQHSVKVIFVKADEKSGGSDQD